MQQSFFKRYLIVIGIVGIALILWFFTYVQAKYALDKAEVDVAFRFQNFKVYKRGAYIPGSQVAGPKGDLVDLTDTDGQYLVLNVWASWCTPCVKELPSLKKLDQKLGYRGSDWQVRAVSIDSADNIDKVAAFVKRYNVRHVAAYHDIQYNLQKEINISKLPTTYLVKPSGEIMYEIQGEAVWHDLQIIEFLELVSKVR